MKPLKWKFCFIGNMGRCSKQEFCFLLFFVIKWDFLTQNKKCSIFVWLNQLYLMKINIHVNIILKQKKLLDSYHKMTSSKAARQCYRSQFLNILLFGIRVTLMTYRVFSLSSTIDENLSIKLYCHAMSFWNWIVKLTQVTLDHCKIAYLHWKCICLRLTYD